MHFQSLVTKYIDTSILSREKNVGLIWDMVMQWTFKATENNGDGAEFLISYGTRAVRLL